MGNRRVVYVACVLAFTLILSSCATNQGGSRPTSEQAGSNSYDVASSDSAITRYDVYENGDRYQNSNPLLREPDEFSIAMANNPIDKKMKNDLKTADISSTRSSQVFFSGYVYIWQDELSSSIASLKTYLSDEDAKKLDTAQANWENSWKSSAEFDRSLIGDKEIGLGTQRVSSGLIYLINQYRDRVAHIKYMTYLTENYVDKPVPSADQLWNKWHVF